MAVEKEVPLACILPVEQSHARDATVTRPCTLTTVHDSEGLYVVTMRNYQVQNSLIIALFYIGVKEFVKVSLVTVITLLLGLWEVRQCIFISMICIFEVYTLQIFLDNSSLGIQVRSPGHNFRQGILFKELPIHPLAKVMIDENLVHPKYFGNTGSSHESP